MSACGNGEAWDFKVWAVSCFLHGYPGSPVWEYLEYSGILLRTVLYVMELIQYHIRINVRINMSTAYRVLYFMRLERRERGKDDWEW